MVPSKYYVRLDDTHKYTSKNKWHNECMIKIQTALTEENWTMLPLTITQNWIQDWYQNWNEKKKKWICTKRWVYDMEAYIDNVCCRGVWYDEYHPTQNVVQQLLITWITLIQKDIPSIKTLLIVGDGTLTFGIDHKSDFTIQDLVVYVKSITGVDIIIRASSCAMFDFVEPWYDQDVDKIFYSQNFTSQVIRSSSSSNYVPGYSVDAILLVGGWNQTNMRSITHLVKEFTTACNM
jgi:hypothetical protein